MWFVDWVVYRCVNYGRPLSVEAAFVKAAHDIERNRQIVAGVYRSETPYSLGGYSVVEGVSYEFEGYQGAHDDQLDAVK